MFLPHTKWRWSIQLTILQLNLHCKNVADKWGITDSHLCCHRQCFQHESCCVPYRVEALAMLCSYTEFNFARGNRGRSGAMSSTCTPQGSKYCHFLKQSVKANDKLIEIQQQLGGEAKKLLQDVITQWNSSYLMYERLVELHHAVNTALCCMDRSDLCLSPDEVAQVLMSISTTCMLFFNTSTSMASLIHSSACLKLRN